MNLGDLLVHGLIKLKIRNGFKPVHKGVGFDANTFVIYNIELVNLSY